MHSSLDEQFLFSKRPPTGSLPNTYPATFLFQGSFHGLSGKPDTDLPSTQVFLNMVRNASTFHQNHVLNSAKDIRNYQQHLQKQLLHLQHQQMQYQNQTASSTENKPPRNVAVSTSFPEEALASTAKKEGNKYRQNLSAKLLQDDASGGGKQLFDTNKQLNTEKDIKESRRGLKRASDSAFPLDLSAVVPTSKCMKLLTTSGIANNAEDDNEIVPHVSHNSSQPPEIKSFSQKPTFPSFWGDVVTNWTVDEVFDFVSSIEICTEYAEVSR